jgi:hypothetical protein
MTSTRTLITDAVRQFPIERTPAWHRLADGNAALQIDHVEPLNASFNTTDCLFDGEAKIVLKDARALQALVFGRFDSRRAEVERIVINE